MMRKLLVPLCPVLLLLLLPAASIQLQTTGQVASTKTSATRAADIASTEPEAVGLSSPRLERIGSTIQKSIDDARISGAVSLVARHGKVAYLKSFGKADRESGKPMQPDQIFRICSMTKPITSIAVMILYEEGHFLLNEPVSDFIPEFKSMKVLSPADSQNASGANTTVDAKSQITIRQLLTHTSGLTYHWNKRIGKQYKEVGMGHGILQQPGTIGDAVKKLASLPLVFQPGETFEYSSSVDVLGYLVEVVSGMPLDKFLQKRMFEPLGMKDTYFFLPPDKVSRLARAYTFYPGKGLQAFRDEQTIEEDALVYSADYPYRGPRTYFSGGGGLCSTAEDYYRFCQMLLNNGTYQGTRLLSRKSVELIRQNQIQEKLDESGFGLGFGVTSEPKHLTELGSIGSFYWGGFFYTSFIIDPKEDMVVIFMGQLHPTGNLNVDRKSIRLAYQAIQD